MFNDNNNKSTVGTVPKQSGIKITFVRKYTEQYNRHGRKLSNFNNKNKT